MDKKSGMCLDQVNQHWQVYQYQKCQTYNDCNVGQACICNIAGQIVTTDLMRLYGIACRTSTTCADVVNKPLGDPCDKDSQCKSRYCNKQWPTGPICHVCPDSTRICCSGNSDCPLNSECIYNNG